MLDIFLNKNSAECYIDLLFLSCANKRNQCRVGRRNAVEWKGSWQGRVKLYVV